MSHSSKSSSSYQEVSSAAESIWNVAANSRGMASSSTHVSQPLTIAVLGETGAGKSSFANTLCGSQANTSGSVQSCTNATRVHEGTFQDGSERHVRIIDTPGLGDTQGRDTAHIAGMVDVFRNKSVHLFCLVVNSAKRRFTESDKSMIAIFSEIFGLDFFKNVVIVFTRWETGEEADDVREAEDIPPKEEIEDDYRHEVKEALNYEGPLSFIYVDNLAAPTVQPPLRTKEQRAKMFRTIQALRMCCEASNPFACTDVKEAMGMLDKAKSQLKKLRARNEELKETHRRQQQEHVQKMAELRRQMDKEKRDGNVQLSNLQSETERIRSEIQSVQARQRDQSASSPASDTSLIALLLGLLLHMHRLQ